MNTQYTDMKALKSVWFILLLLMAAPVFGQLDSNRIQIVHANSVEYNAEVSRAQRFIGAVQFKHQDVTLFCDSAYLYLDSNSVDAYGKVRILQGDSLALFGDTLNYKGHTKSAKINGNVRLNDRDLRLTTNQLNYDLSNNVGSYASGAVITSAKNQNTLTSKEGLYFSSTSTLQFRDSVELVNPGYTMDSDTLIYNTISERSFFHGPTFIRSEENLIYCENGWYDTKLNRAAFEDNAYIISDQQKLEGDSLYYDRNMGFGEVFGNMQITDTTNNFIIQGEYGWHDEDENKSLITDSILLIQLFETDSLFLNSDTVIVLEDSLENRMIHAFHKVEFFKSDMQGKCDSLVFNQPDSSINMYTEPVLWSEENQLTADFIQVKTDSGKIKSMLLDQNAFLISEADTVGFNQIKGRVMNAFFKDNQLSRLLVNGNAQSVYFVGEEGKEYMGMNKANCSNMVLYVTDNKVEKITFLDNPDAVLHPMDQINPKDLILEGFNWYSDIRPLQLADIFK